jgi:hypothetical protein
MTFDRPDSIFNITALFNIQKKEIHIMTPFSYTSLKIVHDQMIEEALERYRPAEEQKTQKRDLRQMTGAFLARFTNISARKAKETIPSCEG